MENCDKCNKEINTEGEMTDAKCLKFKDGEDEYYVIRCNDCYAKDTSLTDYKKTEVYSRVVGYIRPVQQWHKGKQEEYKERVEFKAE